MIIHGTQVSVNQGYMMRYQMLISIGITIILCVSTVHAQMVPPTQAPSTDPNRIPSELIDEAKRSVDKAISFLTKRQDSSGSYGSHVGITAMVLLALAESYRKYTVGDGPFIRRAVEWMNAHARADGAISGDATPTYNTSLAIMALHTLDQKGYQTLIEGGQRFLTSYQNDEDRKYSVEDKYYGGIGYGGDERPDLSNLQYALEALKRTDFDPNSDVWKKAERFVSRCQNFTESAEEDPLPRDWAGNDGGFIYEPGLSKAGGVQSYGAMTFAGLKSLMFTTRSKKDDPRVQAAWTWIQQNYDFNSHPGMGTTAYYYYLQTAASALEAFEAVEIPSKNGEKHNWAADLLARLVNLQKPDGSWVNENRKYWEGNAILVTARGIITINHVLRAIKAQ